MTTYTEVLPPTRSMKHGAVQFTPAADGSPGAGVARIDTDRDSCTYGVSEFPNDWGGRSFRFAKVAEETGTDPTGDAYEVFCGAGEPDGATCSCRGFERWRTCKHLLTVRALLENRWV